MGLPFPPTPLIPNVINKILSHDCHQKIVMVLGSGEPVNSDSFMPTLPTQPSDSTVQQELAQRPYQPVPPCLAPRASTIRVQVEEQIEAPPRHLTRQSGPFSLDGANRIRWTSKRHL